MKVKSEASGYVEVVVVFLEGSVEWRTVAEAGEAMMPMLGVEACVLINGCGEDIVRGMRTRSECRK